MKSQGQCLRSRSKSKVKVKCLMRSGRYLSLACRVQQKPHDTWNTDQDLCVFVSNKGAIKSLAQRLIMFNCFCAGPSRKIILQNTSIRAGQVDKINTTNGINNRLIALCKLGNSTCNTLSHI